MTTFTTSREIPAAVEQVFAAFGHVVVPANEQNLERLSAEVLRQQDEPCVS